MLGSSEVHNCKPSTRNLRSSAAPPTCLGHWPSWRWPCFAGLCLLGLLHASSTFPAGIARKGQPGGGTWSSGCSSSSVSLGRSLSKPPTSRREVQTIHSKLLPTLPTEPHRLVRQALAAQIGTLTSLVKASPSIVYGSSRDLCLVTAPKRRRPLHQI